MTRAETRAREDHAIACTSDPGGPEAGPASLLWSLFRRHAAGVAIITAHSWHEGPGRVPLLSGVLGWLVCRTVARVPAGDHRIVVAEVMAGNDSGRGRPLLYCQEEFTALGPASDGCGRGTRRQCGHRGRQ
jgi:flavin reductase (DIM6/NTAB) family NADH-FMN oxidoreductase RutF